MTTWSILVDNSTLPDNDINTAYAHLLNQDGTGGTGETIYLIGASTADITQTISTSIVRSLSSKISTPRVSAEIINILSTNIISKTTAEIE